MKKLAYIIIALLTLALAVISTVKWAPKSALAQNQTGETSRTNDAGVAKESSEIQQPTVDQSQSSSTQNYAELKVVNQANSPIEGGNNNSQIVNGFNVELISVDRDGDFAEGDYVKADFCFQLPSNDDWQLAIGPDDVKLSANGQDVFYREVGFVEDKVVDTAGTKKERCEYVLFPITSNMNLENFTITIGHLITSTPDQLDCEKGQEKLDKDNTGIKIKCVNSDFGGGYEITQKPKGKTDSEVDKIVREAWSNVINGPWVFETGIK